MYENGVEAYCSDITHNGFERTNFDHDKKNNSEGKTFVTLFNQRITP